MLERAVDIAAERGVLGPSSEHLLLALVSDPGFDGPAILAGLGVDALTLVDAMPGDRRAPASSDKLKHWLLRVGTRDGSPQPGPVAPVFERYTAPLGGRNGLVALGLSPDCSSTYALVDR